MKFLLASDLHLEFYRSDEQIATALPPLPDSSHYDAVLLAGDISVGTKGAHWALKFFPREKEIVYTPGNHCYYKQFGGIQQVDQLFSEIAEENGNFHFLNPGYIGLIGGVGIIGATLWTDCRLTGYDNFPDVAFERSISDFNLITTDGINKFTAADARKLYDHHRDQIEVGLHRLRDVPRIVMTHFVPSQLCIDSKYASDSLNPYFTNDCDDIMNDHKPDAWVYGHTHSRLDMIHPSGTRMIGNPRGYPRENPGFTWKIFEVS
jgi:predicted phosphohydrolase